MVLRGKMGDTKIFFYGRKKWQCFLSYDDGIPKMVKNGNKIALFFGKIENLIFSKFLDENETVDFTTFFHKKIR